LHIKEAKGGVMRHYKITEDLRNEVNRYLGLDYFKLGDLGHDVYRLENYEKICCVSPRKAKLLMATLFPEELHDGRYLKAHKKQIKNLAKKLHVAKERSRPRGWSFFMVRREGLPPTFDPGLRDENILRHNIVRFR